MRDLYAICNGGSRINRLVSIAYPENGQRKSTIVFFQNNSKPEHSYRMRELRIQHLEWAFFATVHVRASKILQSHDAVVGLANDFTVVRDEESLWEELMAFVGKAPKIIPQSTLGDFLCTHYIDNLRIHARNHRPMATLNWTDITSMPPIDIDTILAYKSKGNEGKSAHFVHLLREWNLFRKNGDYFPVRDRSEICNDHTRIELCQLELKDFLSSK
jgi:hypothetical protein